MPAVLQPAPVRSLALAGRLSSGAALAGTLLALCAVYFETARSIVAIWNSSETFAHGYLILPICLWLAWRRRAVLRLRAPAPFWPAVLIVAACGAAWLLAELADAQVVRQYAFVAMLPATVLVIYGVRVAGAMAFPLLFIFLAVPFGEIFIAPLINLTADFTVWALQASGIPVLRDGSNFTIPSGNWAVVEACSGVRYLIASFTLGCLYAYLTYRSLVRRLLFVALAIVVPIAANAVRAYLIVMIGHLSGNTLAVGVDHLIYGWLFFGLVMFLMYRIGSFWREDEVAEVTPLDTSHTLHTARAGAGQFVAAAAGVLLCAGIWPVIASHMEATPSSLSQASLASFRPAWTPAGDFTAWSPRFAAPTAELAQRYTSGADLAALSVLYYRDRPRGAGLINSENRLVRDKDPLWSKGATTTRTEQLGARTLVLRETPLRSAGGALLVWQWYWINGHFLENDYLGKLLQAKGKLLQGADDSAALFASTPLGEQPDAARAVLRRFLTDNLPRIETSLAGNPPKETR